MRIALLGMRGVPANYGGFETCAEEIGKRLARSGNLVRAYNRSGYYSDKPINFQGIELVYIREPKSKSFETILHTLKSVFHALKNRSDIHLVFNIANTPSALLLRLFRRKVVLLVDGLEWKREKWSRVGKLYFRICEWLASKSLKHLVADSRAIQSYYQGKYKKTPVYISYGSPDWPPSNSEILEKHGLKRGEYFLQITRFEPENNPLLTAMAFSGLETEKKLVLVGGIRYSSPYSKALSEIDNPRIVFPGLVFDRSVLFALLDNCFAYVHGNEVGGTNPALLEAMSAGCFVIAREVSFNREVLQDAGVYFQKNVQDLRGKLIWSLNNAERLEELGRKAADVVNKHYIWDEVAEEYLRLFEKISGHSRTAS